MGIHGYNIGKYKTESSNVCLKSMRGDKFKKNIKRNDWKREDNVISNGVNDGKYNIQKLNLKKTNVLIVFSNMELDENILSEDRWVILKISSELSRYNKVRVILPNPELNGGRAEAEKEKNPKHKNQEVYEKIDEKDYNQVEDKREI